MSESALQQRSLFIIDFLESSRARLSGSLQWHATRPRVIAKTTGHLVEDGLVTAELIEGENNTLAFSIPPRQRLAHHRNALMNHFAPAAIVARCLRRQGTHSDYTTLRHDVRWLSALFKNDFSTASTPLTKLTSMIPLQPWPYGV
ncbi:MAG: hypothetical protein R3C68_19015 [Myxococcota bacterium]